MVTSMETTLLLAICVSFYITVAEGAAHIEVRPNPGIIYHNAPVGVPVLAVKAFDDVTGDPLNDVTLTTTQDANYFVLSQQPTVLSEYALKVKKAIDKPVGFVFSFNVYARYNGTLPDRRIRINVTEYNQYAPSFDATEYTFSALRDGFGANLFDVGTVHATDQDAESYNRIFQYFIMDAKAGQYFVVDPSTGDLELVDTLPPDVRNMTFNVTAIDAGSPQRLNSTRVTVTITDLKPPDVFCVAVDTEAARICWKDPTNGSYVMKYELLLQVNGENATKVPVDVKGYQDETCSIIKGDQLGKNYTFTVRVLNGLEWSPDSLQRKVKIERSGLYGDCPAFSNCSTLEPCRNSGECLINPDNSYMCNCTRGWGGVNCSDEDLCQSGSNPCQNGGACSFTGNRTVDCACPPSYYGDYCEKVSPCTRRPCGQGQCLARGEGHICQCPDETTRLHCDDVFCREDNNFYDKTGRYTWPRTKVAELARVRCRHGVKTRPNIEGVAIRRCSVNIDGDAFWDYPDTSDCKELSASDVSGNLKSLASLTDDASGLQPDEIANITSTLEEYFFFSFSNQEIATEMTMVVGNLLDANESVIIESNSRNHSSDRLLWLLDEYVSKVNTTTNVTIETENINLRVVNYTSPDTSFSYSPLLLDNNRTTKGGVTLTIPPEALDTSGTQDSNPRIQLMAFRSSSLFIPEQDVPPQDVVLKQWVVTAVVNRRNISNLTMPVEINIQNIEEGGNHTCVYWDVDNHVWSNVGVVTKRQTSGHTKCLSYHLTSFAVLLDPSSDTALSSKHETILTYISYIGCGISIFGLILTLISYSMFRCLNREKSGKILMNLCLSMLIMNVVFVLGSEASLSNNGDAICKSVAILLHYFLLSTLTWMLVEAINMYQALITVFAKYSGFFMLKRCAFAWGLPALIVIVTLAVNLDNYKTTTELCFLSQGNSVAFFAALLGPACLILLINTIVFIMVSRVILRPRFKGQVGTSGGDSINPAQIRGAFTVMTLLGITWVFGPLAINEAKLVINYIFTILNSLQGFLIFVFRCCFNPEVRMSWVLLIKTGKFKRRKGPLSAFTSDTNSKSEGKINGSYADTLKSNMYNNSLGRPKNGHAVDNGSKSSSDTSTKHVAKDYHTHFEDLNKYNGVHGKPGPRRPGTNEHARLYSGEADASRGEPRNGISNRSSPGSDQDRNGNHGNHGHHRHNGDHGKKHGVTTIYTGKYNDNRRRSSGYVATQDEFTRL